MEHEKGKHQMGMGGGDKHDGMKMDSEMEEYMKACEARQKKMGGNISHTAK